MKQILKKCIPSWIWADIRKKRILSDQNRISALCDSYIDSYFKNIEGHYNLVPKKDLTGKKILWQYWAQGFDEANLPDVVKNCLASVDANKGDYEIIRLSDNDIADYIDFPDFVYERKPNYPTL